MSSIEWATRLLEATGFLGGRAVIHVFSVAGPAPEYPCRWNWSVLNDYPHQSPLASRVTMTMDDAKEAAEIHFTAILRSAGWIPASEATRVSAERQAVRFAAVDLPAEVNHDRAQIEALGRRLTEEESLTALGRWMVGEGEHLLIKPAD